MKKHKTIYLDKELVEVAENVAFVSGRSFTWLAEQAIRKFIKFKSKEK